MRWSDWVLVGIAAALVAFGPIMALQEMIRAQDQEANRVILGELPPVETQFRLAWRLPLTVLVIVATIVGAFAAMRALVEPRVRAVSTRVLGLMLGGLALFDITYWIDGAFFLEQPYVLRAATVVWLYTIAGILIAGSARRLAQLQDYFGYAREHDFKL